MKVISLSKFAEESRYLELKERKFGGAVEDPESFRKNLDALDRQFHGVLCFVAFHPVTDRAVAEYVVSGTLGQDAGAQVLALFLARNEVRFPRELTAADIDLGVKIEAGSHPVYELLDWAFPAENRPPLPGLIFFDKLSIDILTAVYVPLAGLDSKGVTERCRSLFFLARESLKPSVSLKRLDLDFDLFCNRLDQLNIHYLRTGPATVQGRIYSFINWLDKHRAEILAAIGKAIPAASHGAK
jgi:hypothetical protein